MVNKRKDSLNDHDRGEKAESPKCMRPFTFSKAIQLAGLESLQANFD